MANKIATSTGNGIYIESNAPTITVDSASFNRLVGGTGGITYDVDTLLYPNADRPTTLTKTTKSPGRTTRTNLVIKPVIDPRTEYVLIMTGSSGDFQIGETIRQVDPHSGASFDAVVSAWITGGVNYGAGNTATQSLDYKTVSFGGIGGVYGSSFPILGIYQAGPTNPANTTAATGPIGCIGATKWGPFTGLSSGAQRSAVVLSHQAVSGFSGSLYPQYITTSNHRNNMVSSYEESLRGATFVAHYGYTAGSTWEITFADSGEEAAPAAGADDETSLLREFQEVSVNHDIFASTNPKYISTVTITDYAGVTHSLRTGTGGSGGGSDPGEFQEIVAEVVHHNNARGASIDYIRNLANGASYDSVNKLNTIDITPYS